MRLIFLTSVVATALVATISAFLGLTVGTLAAVLISKCFGVVTIVLELAGR